MKLKDGILVITTYSEKEYGYRVKFNCNAFNNESKSCFTNYYSNPYEQVYLGNYLAALTGLQIAKRYSSKINTVVVSCPPEEWNQGVCLFPLGKKRPKNPILVDYTKKALQLKKELQALGITVHFAIRNEQWWWENFRGII
jgi:hypothetical protein